MWKGYLSLGEEEEHEEGRGRMEFISFRIQPVLEDREQKVKSEGSALWDRP